MSLSRKKPRAAPGDRPAAGERYSDALQASRVLTSATADEVAVPATPGRQHPPITPSSKKAHPVKETTMDDNKKRALAVAFQR